MAKYTFASHSFRSHTFASGAFVGVGVDVEQPDVPIERTASVAAQPRTRTVGIRTSSTTIAARGRLSRHRR